MLIAEEDRGFASISELVEAHACTQAYTQTTILSQARPNQPQRGSPSAGSTNVDIDWDKISTETVQADGDISEEGSERKRINMIS